MSTPTKNINLVHSGLPERLHSLREEQRLTKADLAGKSGLSARTVHDLENGRRDRIQEKTLMLLAQALGVSIVELLGRDPATEFPPDTPTATMASPVGRMYISQPVGLAILAVLTVILVFAGGYFWSYARDNAEWTCEGDQLTVRDGIFGLELWRLGGENRLSFCKVSPWDDTRLLVGVGGQTPGGGHLLNLDRATGDTIWTAAPDIDAVVRAFGAEDVEGVNFHCIKADAADLDGDGEPELIAQFLHGKFYPFVICALDRQGRILGQYANKGHVHQSLILDLDGDGKDEFIGAGTNNAKDYQGATIFILDQDHWRGASVDSLCDPWSSEPDSARVRLVIPQYPGPYMKLLQETRLYAFNLRVHRDSQGEVLITADVGSPSLPQLIVYMDDELHPKGSETTDRFQEVFLSQWPDSLTTNTGLGDPVWRARWLANHKHFEAGHWPPNAD